MKKYLIIGTIFAFIGWFATAMGYLSLLWSRGISLAFGVELDEEQRMDDALVELGKIIQSHPNVSSHTVAVSYEQLGSISSTSINVDITSVSKKDFNIWVSGEHIEETISGLIELITSNTLDLSHIN